MTAGTGTDATAPNCWTFRKPGGSTGSLQGGTAAGNDEVDARERVEVRHPLRERRSVGGGHHDHDREDHERGSTRPGGTRERKRSDCEDRRWGAGSLPTCRHDARRGTRGALAAAAAATKAQAQTAAKTAARAQAKVSTYTHTR